MHPKAPALLLSLVAALTAAAGLVLGLDGWPRARQEARSREFQQLVGGLGFGPAADLSRCPFSFDPRLCPHCPQDHGPIPGGVYFCPHHACSVFPFPPLRSDAASPETTRSP
jgi:hypothetical protein